MPHKGVRIPISLLRDGCGDVMVCLPYSGSLALLALSERLLWGSTWIDGDGRNVKLSDSQRQEMDDTITGLQNIMCTNELITILEGIRDAIGNNNGEDMTTIYNNVCCGCGCGSSGGSLDGGGVDTQPPDGYETPDLPPLDEPDIPDFVESYAAFKCSRSYWLHYEFRSAALEIDNLWSIGNANYESVDAEIAGGLGLLAEEFVFLWEAYYNLMSWLIQAVTSVTMTQIVSALDSAQSLFVCALYGSDGVNDARDRFLAVIDGLNLPWATRYWLTLLEQNIDYTNWLYPEDWSTVEIPATWQNRDCSSCGGDEPSPDPIESGLFWRDWTGTSGKFYVDDVLVGTTGISFDYNRAYVVRGDSAGHMDAEICAGAGGSGGRVVIEADVTNNNAYPIVVVWNDGVQDVNYNFLAGETVRVTTNILDYTFANANDSFTVVPIQLG